MGEDRTSYVNSRFQERGEEKVIEEDIKNIKEALEYLAEEMDNIKKHLIPEKQDTTELSNKAEEELKTGDEPRHYRKCRRCGKKPCICEEPTDK